MSNINHDAVARREERRIQLAEERMNRQARRDFERKVEKLAKVGRNYKLEYEYANLEKNYPALETSSWNLYVGALLCFASYFNLWLLLPGVILAGSYFFYTMKHNQDKEDQYNRDKEIWIKNRRKELYTEMVQYWVKWAIQNAKKARNQLVAHDTPEYFSNSTIQYLQNNVYPRLKDFM